MQEKITVYPYTFERIHNARGGLFDLLFKKEHLNLLPKSGKADKAVQELLRNPFIAAQVSRINPEELKNELREYGAWEENELNDHRENLTRIVWLSALSIREDPEPWTLEIELDETGLLVDW